jgi:hypothetical protein
MSCLQIDDGTRMGRSKDTDRRARAWAMAGCRSVAASVVRIAVTGQPAHVGGGTWQDAWVLVGPETVGAADADSRN